MTITARAAQRRSVPTSLALGTALAAALAAVPPATPADAAPSAVTFTSTSVSQPVSTLEPGLFHEFVGENGRMLQYHFFDNGDNGTLFYFDGDQTTNFHYPLVDASVVHEPGVGNGHVQRMNEEAAAHGMDLVFLEHPHGEDVPLGGPVRVTGTSWWNYMDDSTGGEVDEYAAVVREIIGASGAQNVQLVGYSGGAEFLARHLLVVGNDWLPWNSAATFIGGGGAITGEYTPAPPAPGKEDMPYVYTVGLLDGTDPNAWSALHASRNAVTQWNALGYSGAVLDEVPGVNHYNYDFRGIVRSDLDALLDRAAQGDPQVAVTSLSPTSLTVSASGFRPGTPVTLRMHQGSRVVKLEADAAVAYDGTFKGEVSITGAVPSSFSPGAYTVTATVGETTSAPVRHVVKP